MILNPRTKKMFRMSRCRAEGCRKRTRQVYSIVAGPGLTVRVHLCGIHHDFERKYGAHALALKPVTPPVYSVTPPVYSHEVHQALADSLAGIQVRK